jgi:acid phosphatase (class A)
MKRFNFAAALMLLCLSLSAQGVKDEKFSPFYTKDEAPKMEKVIPNPPELTDAQFFYDWTQYQWGKSIRDTERGQLAVADAGINAEYFMKRFSPCVGRDLTPQEYPHLYRLFSRLHLTEQQAGASAKAFFHRVRPYQQYKEPTSVPRHENPQDFSSYPSGHTHASWLVGMALVALDPAHTEEIMKAAYELGQSRVIVGFHYQSDVDMGRVVGSITFARLQSEPEFQKMMEKARKEYQKKGK